MEIIKEADFRRRIKSSPQTGYLFFGEEDYMKNYAVGLASDAISPDKSLSFFNEIRFDAFTYSPSALLDAIMAMPMMAERKLIVVSGLDFNAMRSSEVDELCRVLSSLSDYDCNTVIINAAADRFDAGMIPKRPSALLNKLGEYLQPVVFEKNSPAKLSVWVGKHFEHNGVRAASDVCSLVVEICGRDMFKLASETDKLSYYVRANGGDEVTAADVKSVAIPAAEHDAFAFTNAIGTQRRADALEILCDMKQRRLDPIMIMGEISKTVCDLFSVLLLAADGLTVSEISNKLKVHEYRVGLILKSGMELQTCKQMIDRCASADMEIKSSRDGYSVIERLICTM